METSTDVLTTRPDFFFGGELITRKDDRREVVESRLNVYEEQTAPVVNFYGERDKLSQVYGVGTIEEISARIMGVIKLAQQESA